MEPTTIPLKHLQLEYLRFFKDMRKMGIKQTNIDFTKQNIVTIREKIHRKCEHIIKKKFLVTGIKLSTLRFFSWKVTETHDMGYFIEVEKELKRFQENTVPRNKYIVFFDRKVINGHTFFIYNYKCISLINEWLNFIDRKEKLIIQLNKRHMQRIML